MQAANALRVEGFSRKACAEAAELMGKASGAERMRIKGLFESQFVQCRTQEDVNWLNRLISPGLRPGP